MTQLSILEVGPKCDRALSQWFTPTEVAREMARMAAAAVGAHKGARIIEPSAGRGNLARAVLEEIPDARVDVVDVDERWRPDLEALGSRVTVEIVDYLSRPSPREPYDLAITNPPYDRGVESAHLAKMLDECERVIALLPARSLHGVDRFERVWSRIGREWALREIVHLVRRPKFGPQCGGSDEIVLLHMVRGAAQRCSVRWL